MAVVDNGEYRVDPDKVIAHVDAVRADVGAIERLAQQVPGYYTGGTGLWTGADGGDAMLRTCLGEISRALLKTSTSVQRYVGSAETCAVSYARHDAEIAEAFRQCLPAR
jgi:hypothetical protein